MVNGTYVDAREEGVKVSLCEVFRDRLIAKVYLANIVFEFFDSSLTLLVSRIWLQKYELAE